jgi:hypothetical protein
MPGMSELTECTCGAPLCWETRQTPGNEPRWLGVCSSQTCGQIHTPGHASSDALRYFLLGDRPLAGDCRPWSRFVQETTRGGYYWCAGCQPCHTCDRGSTIALNLRADSDTDPFRLVLCPDCGASVVYYWRESEHVGTWLEASAWDEKADATRDFVRAAFARLEPPTSWEWEWE